MTKTMREKTWILLTVLLAACDTTGRVGATVPPDVHEGLFVTCENEGTGGATAGCLRPTLAREYYVAQAEAYFDTLDVDADHTNIPNYAENVARWEWPPWLLLTGYGRDNLIDTAGTLRRIDPSTVPERDCRFFEVQPFARCYVVFQYEGGPCPIYEEFVFNDAGEITFIEAWSDLPGLNPTTDEDRWGAQSDIGRLSTRWPGLGTAEGAIDLESEALKTAAANDPDIADFATRAADFWRTWVAELLSADPNFFAHGCGW